MDRVRQRQAAVLNNLLNPGRMQRLVETEVFEGAEAYTLPEFLDDVKASVWVWGQLDRGEPIDVYRRALQRAHVERLEWLLTEEPESNLPRDRGKRPWT